MNRFFLEVSYDGGPWNGWQKQANAPTVQGTLEDCLNKMLRPAEWLEIMGSGRTDTGVHCLRQYAHFDAVIPMALEDFTHKLNAFLPPGIAVRRIVPVQQEAHARFSALSREYLYLFTTRKWPLLSGKAHWLPHPPDWERMQQAARLFLEHEDFEAFSKTRTNVHTFRCQLMESRFLQGETLSFGEWPACPPLTHAGEGLIAFQVRANRFLKGMVRSMVGTLLRIGYGKMTQADLLDMLHKKRPASEKILAPAHGLYLTNVQYPDQIWNMQ